MLDARGRTLCYVYCGDDEKNAEIANVLAWDEGGSVAAKIARLPDLLISSNEFVFAKNQKERGERVMTAEQVIMDWLRLPNHGLAKGCRTAWPSVR